MKKCHITSATKPSRLKSRTSATVPFKSGSHYHFYEANEEGLRFDRKKAFGKRLDIPAGTAVRFEPGEKRTVNLIDFGGKRRIFGFNNRVNGYLDESTEE